MTHDKPGPSPLARGTLLPGVIEAPKGFFGDAAQMISEDAWRASCQEYLDALANRESFTVDDDEEEED